MWFFFCEVKDATSIRGCLGQGLGDGLVLRDGSDLKLLGAAVQFVRGRIRCWCIWL